MPCRRERCPAIAKNPNTDEFLVIEGELRLDVTRYCPNLIHQYNYCAVKLRERYSVFCILSF